MEKLAGLICAAKADLLANMQARAARLEKAFANANQGLHPKQDCNGRHHAPCDGYVLAGDDWLDYPQGTQEFYGKGEFCLFLLTWKNQIVQGKRTGRIIIKQNAR